MSTVPARTGRLRQRYEDNFRLVSGCIPYRYRKGSDDQEEGDAEDLIEVLMVSSPNRNDLVFPKGGWEDDETVIEAACREALEEAGVRGIPREFPLGRWEFKSKSSQDILSLEGGCRGYMFALEVTEELETWPEKNNRDRLWLNIREAFRLCRYDWMCRALEEFLRVVAEDRELKRQKEQVDPPSIPLTKSYKRPSNAQHHSTSPRLNVLAFSSEQYYICFLHSLFSLSHMIQFEKNFHPTPERRQIACSWSKDKIKACGVYNLVDPTQMGPSSKLVL